MKPIRIELVVRQQGHVPSFKNSKMIARGRLITDPKKRKWMDRCIQNFESQLLCACQTGEAGTLTVPLPRSLIALSLPQDDSRQWIPSLRVDVLEVSKGMEGARILIEPI